MNVSAFSVLMAVVWFNVAILLVAVLRSRSAFLMRHGASVLLALFFLGVARVVLPLDLPFSYVVQSWHIMPAIQRFLSAEPVPGNAYITTQTVLFSVWLIGFGVALYRAAARLYREKACRDQCHAVASPQAARVLARMGVKNVSVSVVEDLHIPIVFGVFRAHIYLPRMELTDAELELVLTHELRHVKSHDTLIKLLYLALCIIFWWNPLVAIFQDDLNRLLELRCDAAVVKSLGEEKKRAYLKSILAVMKQASAPGDKHAHPMNEPAFAGASGLFSDGSSAFLKQRFELVLLDRKTPAWARTASLSVVVAAFLLSFLVIVQPSSQPTGDMMEAGIAITPQNAYIIVEDDIWKLYVDGKYFWSLSDEERCADIFLDLPKFEGGQLE
ncbi:MAG: M56 family metallopeptidase [Clostridia bacterium]|nr:M56 family metallopeptidase [Clostridia bacterium]